MSEEIKVHMLIKSDLTLYYKAQTTIKTNL
jgi:hypothetical protein